MLKNLDAPNTKEIRSYHAWMEKHSPIDRTESLFLSHKSDLVSFKRRRRSITNTTIGGAGAGAGAGVGIGIGVGVGLQSAVIGFPLILVLPLMAFAIVPGLLGRLFMLILIGAGELMLVTSTELMDLMSVKEWAFCSSV
jgi:hypothetical protein